MKIYKYYFLNIEKPLSITARKKDTARIVLEIICNNSDYVEKGFILNNLIRETSETLVADVSTKETKTGKLFWNGKSWQKKN